MPRPDTEPRRQLNVRVPADLWEAVDTRHKTLGLSRDAWVTKVLTWAVTQPLPTEQDQ